MGTDLPNSGYMIRRSLKIVMENPNHLNELNEAIPEVNPVVPEPNQVMDIHDPNEMVDIPDDIDLVDYDEEDPEEHPEEDPDEDPEEDPEEDVDIELEDDAELIFPYEVEGDKTPPPGDVSSDSVSFDSERDLEASHAQARVLEVELEGVGIGEWGECHIKKRLAEAETKVAWARMERDIAKRRLHESQVWNKIFYLDMVRIGAVPKPPSNDEDTQRPRKKSKNSSSDGTEGP
ncbi:hypothetical protein Tco_1315747, partial [Tanacetum coccineum]